MSAPNLLPPYTIELDTAKNYLSAFRTGAINNGSIVEYIKPAQQQEIMLRDYWAPKNGLGSGEKYDYSNTPSCLTMKAFTFALKDISDLLNRISNFNGGEPVQFFPDGIEPDLDPELISGIRFYLGMKPNPAYVPGWPTEPEYIPCLVFLPVTGFVPGYFKDNVYISANAGIDKTSLPVRNKENTGEEASALYDFSFPCPKSCPVAEL